MNLLRPTFISAFVLLLLFSGGYAVSQLGHGSEPLLSWLGLLLAAGSPLMFLAIHRLLASRATPPEPIGFSMICGLGVAITMTSSWRFGGAAGNVHLAAGTCLLLWFIYLKWIRRQ